MDNAQKIAIARSQNEFAKKKVLDGIQLTGKDLPCSVVSLSGWIVTVKFELDAAPWTLPNVTVPVDSSEYDYLPLQVGDPGVVRAADARLGGLSGLGGGTAKLKATPGNLSTLVFSPFGKKAWSPPGNPNLRVVQGPDGVLIRDLASNSTILLTATEITATRGGSSASIKDASAVIAHGGNNVTVDASGVAINGTLSINGKAYLAHEHTGVQAGGSNSGGVHDP